MQSDTPGVVLKDRPAMLTNPRLRAALAAAGQDEIIFDLAAIEASHRRLTRDLPGIVVRFAVKACPVDDVLRTLALAGAGFDAAGPNEIVQALCTGVPPNLIHYGNTAKSDRNIAAAYDLGIRDFATDSIPDVRAIAAHAPGSRVFCRLATTGAGAVWELAGKSGCAVADAVTVLETARALGLTPSGLSLHVGSQQMSPAAWRQAFVDLADGVTMLRRRGIHVEHVNLGGGLPAHGYRDRQGVPLIPPIDAILAEIRHGMRHLRQVAGTALRFVLEPGRYLIADHGAIRAHVVRLTARQQRAGARTHWLYLSCGKFNGMYEVDRLQYRLEFPTHPTGPTVPAVIAGPTCDSDDAYAPNHPVPVPIGLKSGDPVWVLSAGAYSISYLTVGFNGMTPLSHRTLPSRPLTEAGHP